MPQRLLYYQGRVARALDQAAGVIGNGAKIHLERLRSLKASLEEFINDESSAEVLQLVESLVDDIDVMEMELSTSLSMESVNSAGSAPKPKLPKINFREFDEKNPQLWFSQLDNQFEANGIQREIDQFITFQFL